MKPKILNQRSIAAVLLVALLLENCGIAVPMTVTSAGEQPVRLQGNVIGEGREGIAVAPDMLGRQQLQMGSCSTSKKSSLQQQYNYIHQSSFYSTQQLVSAFNTTQDIGVKQALHRWLEAYVDLFADKKVEVLDEELVQEYACLANIQLTSGENQSLLYKYFKTLANKLNPNLCGEEDIIQALSSTLWQIDDAVFGRSTSNLLKVGNWLLTKVDPDNPQVNLDKANYRKYASTLSALHNTLLLIRKIDSQGWSPSRNEKLYNRFQATIEAIGRHTDYYPYVYCSHLLSKTLKALGSSESQLSAKVWQGVKALARGYDVGRKLLTEGEIDVEAIEKAGRELRQACCNLREDIDWLVDDLYGDKEQPTWYKRLGKLSEAGLYVLDDARAWSVLNSQIEEIKDPSILRGECASDCKALQYGVISQLVMLALHSKERTESLRILYSLTEMDLWNQEKDIMTAIFEGILIVARQDQKDTRRQSECGAAAYLTGLAGQVQKLREAKATSKKSDQGSEQSPKTPEASYVRCFAIKPNKPANTLVNPTEPELTGVLKAMQEWLGEETVEERLNTHYTCTQGTTLQHRLFDEVKGDLIVKLYHRVQAQPPETLSEADMQVLLKGYYQKPGFKEMPSFIQGEPPMSVEAIECHLKINEQIEVKEENGQDQLAEREERLKWIKTSIELKDLFKKRSLKPKEPGKEINKVLLVGEAGTGKTSLTKKLAYDWSTGQWGQEFKAVYVLPIRALQTGQYDGTSYTKQETLATAVANECFIGSGMRAKEDFERLCRCIQASLNHPATLVILDGLDEKFGASQHIIEEAKSGNHKLMLTSRPYTIEKDERDLVDVEVDHAGLQADQRDRLVKFILTNVSQNASDGLITFIKSHQLGELFQVPVNLKILCYLWKDKGAKLETYDSPMSLPVLYRELVDYIWERFKHKFDSEEDQVNLARDLSEQQSSLYDDLEKIAFESLQQGEIVIKLSSVKKILRLNKQPSKLLATTGFLLFQNIDFQIQKDLREKDKMDARYQFPHLTFQEYFAGRSLARLFLSEESVGEEKVAKFLRDYMYISRYQRALTFMSGEIAESMQYELNREILRSKPGIIHELLQLINLLPQEILGFQHLSLQLRLLNEWLLIIEDSKEKTEALSGLENIFQLGENLNMWFKKSLFQYNIHGKSIQVLHDILLSLLSQVSGVTKHYSDMLLSLILNALKDSRPSARIAAMQALRITIEKGVDVNAVLLPILGTLKDNHSSVRIAALQVLPTLVDKGADVQDLLPPILNSLKNRGYDVRSAARGALLTLFQKVTDVQDLLSLILNALKDSFYDIRRAALQVLPILVAKGAHVQLLLPYTLNALKDNNDFVRSAAREALTTLTDRGTDVELLLPYILNTLKDNDYDIRSAATEALQTLVAKGHNVQFMLPYVLNVLKDSHAHCDVRSAVTEALQTLVKSGTNVQLLLPPILNVFKSSDSFIRRDIIRVLPTLLEQRAGVELLLPYILNALKDWDSCVRRAVIPTLQTLLEQGAGVELLLPYILNALEDRDAYVRMVALQALRTLLEQGAGVELLLPYFLNALEDGDSYVRIVALQALRTLLEQGADVQLLIIPILNALKASDSNLINVALQALQALLEQGADVQVLLSHILNALKDTQWRVRKASITALGTLAEEGSAVQAEVLPYILEGVQDSYYAVRSTSLQVLQTLLKECAFVQELLSPILNTLKDSHSDVRRDALKALQALVAKGLSAQVILPLILTALKDVHPDVRIAAIHALWIPLEQGIDLHIMLLPVLKALKDSSYFVRSVALQALLILLKKCVAVQELLSPILNTLKDGHCAVRSDAPQTLVTLVAKGDLAQDLVQHILKSLKDIDSDARIAVIHALWTLLENRVDVQVLSTPILNALKDADSDVRKAILEALQTPVDQGVYVEVLLAPILNVVLKDIDSNFRITVTESLWILLEKWVYVQVLLVPILNAALKDIDSNFRIAAREALWTLLEKGADVYTLLLPILNAALKDADSNFRIAAREALWTLLEKGADVHVLLPDILNALNDSDFDVQSAAKEVIERISTRSLMDHYWEGKDQNIIPLLISRLYVEPLTIEQASELSHQKLILRSTTGDIVKTWKKSREEVDAFKTLIQEQAHLS